MSNRRKTRQRPHTPGAGTHPQQSPLVEYVMNQQEMIFYQEERALALNAERSAMAYLASEGASQDSIDFLRDVMRAICVAEVWEMDLERIVVAYAESRGTSPSLRTAVTKKLLGNTVADTIWE